MQIFTYGSAATQNDISKTNQHNKNKQVQESFQCHVVSTQSQIFFFVEKNQVVKIKKCEGGAVRGGGARTHLQWKSSHSCAAWFISLH